MTQMKECGCKSSTTSEKINMTHTHKKPMHAIKVFSTNKKVRGYALIVIRFIERGEGWWALSPGNPMSPMSLWTHHIH